MSDVLSDLRNELLRVAELTMKYAKDLNIPSAEAFVIKESVTEVHTSRGHSQCRDGIVQGVGIRVAVGKKIGFASCSGFVPENIKTTLEQAYKIAKKSPEDPRFPGFPATTKPGKEGILDPEVTLLDGGELTNQVFEIEKSGKEIDERVLGLEVEAGATWGGYVVATTEGLTESSMYTAHYAYAGALAIEKGERSSGFEVILGRKVQDVISVGKKSAEQALNHLGAKALNDSIVVPTIWHPLTAAQLLGISLTFGLNGGSVVEKRNPLMTKLNEEIANSALTIVDDGQDPEKVSTQTIDGEGTGKQKTPVIENGVLKSFLFDRLYANAFGTESTGNAIREDNARFEVLPQIRPNKLVIEPHAKTLDEQIAECDKGIYIEGNLMGIGHSNFITGDFSVTATNAYLVEKGEIKYPLKPVSIAGNFFKSLKDLSIIGSDVTPTFLPMDAPALTILNHTTSG